MRQLTIKVAFTTIAIFIYVVFTAKECTAQSVRSNIGTPLIRDYSKQDYQGGTQNWSICEDGRGILYIANNDGILEYDGTNWELYQLPNRTICRSVAKDRMGRIFAGGQGEIGYLQPAENGIMIFHSLLNHVPSDESSFTDVWQIFPLDEGLYFRSSGNIYYLKDDSIITYNLGAHIDFMSVVDDVIYAHDPVNGLMRIREDTLEIISSEFSSEVITATLPNSEGILFTSLKNGIFLFDGEHITPWHNQSENYLRNNNIYSATPLENGYAFATSFGGSLITDFDGKPIYILNKGNGLLNNSVLSIYVRHNGNLWLGLDNGINEINLSSAFRQIFPDRNLEGTAYAAIVYHDNLYLGTNNGLYVIPWQDYYNPFDEIEFKLVKNTRGQVWGLKLIDDDLLMGHHEGAFLIKDDEAVKIADTRGYWTFAKLDDRHMIGGNYDGISLFEKNNQWQFVKQLDGFAESSRFLEVEGGNIWISHPYRGIFKLNLNGNFDTITSLKRYGADDGLISDLFNQVMSIQEQLLFSSERGIYRYDSDSDKFIPAEEWNAILGKEVQLRRLWDDGSQHIWFVINETVGILQIDDLGLNKQVEKKLFPELENRLVGGFQYIYPYDDNNIFIGTESGFLHFDPSKFEDESDNQIMIRQVSTFNEQDSILFGGGFWTDTGMMASQPESYILSLSPKVSNIRFEVSSLNPSQLSETKFSYFMEGMDKNWSNWTSNSIKEYTNLNPGDYIFKVKTKNLYGNDGQVAIYRFNIEYPWYKSGFALIMLSLLILATLLLLIIRPRMTYKKERAKLQLKQEREIKAKDEAFQKVKQESDQTIESLQNEKLQSEVYHMNQQLASVTMHLVQKSEILLGLKTELQVASKENDLDLWHKKLHSIIKTIENDIRLDDNWEQFEFQFDKVHSGFMDRLRKEYPDLSPKYQKLCAYLKMNLSTKEIAPLMNISIRGVEISRYRLRKKMGLESGENLTDFIMKL